jgi:RNA polymerase sigma factor (sigma-70 family)
MMSPRPRHAPTARDQLDAWLPTVLRWCVRLGGPRVDAEDAAHDVLVTAMLRIDDLRDPAAIGAWLFGITRRTLAAHRRRAWARHWLPGWFADPVDPARGPLGEAEHGEVARRVAAVLAELPAELREVLVLCEVEERSDDEAAALIGIPTGTAKSRLRRARHAFAAKARHHGLGLSAVDP